MKFARTIRLDISDQNIFPNPAEPEEFAVAGTFSFFGQDPASWSNKEQLAFKNGWMGLASFGRSTMVQVVVVPDTELDGIVRTLAGHLFEACGAPDMMAALEAARSEVEDMMALCTHPAGTLLAIEREWTGEGISEKVRAIPPKGDGHHAQIWGVQEED